MTVEEIFAKLHEHIIKGMMFHDQMCEYYDFLGLHGYKRCHEYHFFCETISKRKMNRYYMNRYNKLLDETEFEGASVIPQVWRRYTRQEVDNSTKRNAVENGVSEWLKWEKETHELYTELYRALCELGETTAAGFVECMIHDVEKEITHAERKQLDLEAAEYSLAYVLSEQKHIHDKYKRKVEKMVMLCD